MFAYEEKNYDAIQVKVVYTAYQASTSLIETSAFFPMTPSWTWPFLGLLVRSITSLKCPALQPFVALKGGCGSGWTSENDQMKQDCTPVRNLQNHSFLKTLPARWITSSVAGAARRWCMTGRRISLRSPFSPHLSLIPGQVALYYEADQSVVTKITKDAKMTWSDKVSWVGGNMGLFTGFSLISGFELLYWIWFKARDTFDNCWVSPLVTEPPELTSPLCKTQLFANQQIWTQDLF